MKIQEKIGFILRDLRVKKNISQEKLAFEADIDRTYIQSIEKGRRNVSVGILEKILNTIDISFSDFFNEVEKYDK